MAKNCESFCTDYANGRYHTPMADINYATAEPWVEVTIGNFLITTGNKASGSNTNASVLDFEYSAIGLDGNGGHQIKFTIIDENGSDLYNFLTEMFSCLKDASAKYLTKVKFGWCGRKESSAISKFPESKTITALILNFGVIFNEGKVKYEITCSDLPPVSQIARVDIDCPNMFLKDAIRKVGKDIEPKWETEFKYPNGKDELLFFDKGTITAMNGPFGNWQAKQTSKIECIRSWLSSYRCKGNGNEGKPFGIIWDYTKETPTLRITTPIPDDEQQSLGTFIVNGGECSVVTSFTTNFNFLTGLAGIPDQGGNVDNQTAKEEKIEPKYLNGQSAKECQSTAGLSSVTIVDENAQKNYSEDDATKETNISNKMNNLGIVTAMPTIEAEMRIIGNPTDPFIWPAFRGELGDCSRYCGIIVVNPFQLKNGGKNNCPMWMRSSDCNEVLSNKKWNVMGINHQISGGNYTTTIKLKLYAPGVHVPPGSVEGIPL